MIYSHLSPVNVRERDVRHIAMCNVHVHAYSNHQLSITACYTCFGIWDMVKILAYGAQIAGC